MARSGRYYFDKRVLHIPVYINETVECFRLLLLKLIYRHKVGKEINADCFHEKNPCNPIQNTIWKNPCMLLGHILLVPSVFTGQKLNSETSGLCRRSFPFSKEWAYRFCKVLEGNLRGSQAKLPQRKHIRTRILSKSAKPFSWRSRRFGRPSKPTIFWKTVPKEQDFEDYQKQKTACWKEKVRKVYSLYETLLKLEPCQISMEAL